jgi:hypothetical protein
MAPRVRKDRLEVHPDREPAGTDASAGAAREVPYVEPDQYGLRVGWESEAVRLEPAQFLVAPVQESSRRRLARVMARMREQASADRR